MAGVGSLLDPDAREPSAPAIVAGDRTLTYAEVADRAERLAEAIPAAAGERVAVLGPNSAALIAGVFAVWRLGAVAVPLGARLRAYEVERALADADAVALVSVDQHGGHSFAALAPQLFDAAPTLRRCVWVDDGGGVSGATERPSPASGDPAPLGPEIAALLYTSGSTGEPKGVLVTHASELAAAESAAAVLALRPGERALFVVPVAHAFGLIAVLATLASGGCAVMAEASLSPAPLFDAIAATGAGVLHGSPSLFAGLVKAGGDRLSALRTGLVAGAWCPPALLAELDGAGVRILNMYGMTEIGAATCCRLDDPADVRHTTVGRALPGYRVRIDDGEVQVRSDYVTPGYHGRPDASAAAFDDGWFRTGDAGSLDAGGNLVISGRRKEIVNVAGFNVFPSEVEGFLMTHPDVAQAVVAGVPHDRMGEVLRAWVVLRPGTATTSGALVRFARERIAGYKVPYGVEIVDELPLLPSGKPDRTALSRQAREAIGAVG